MTAVAMSQAARQARAMLPLLRESFMHSEGRVGAYQDGLSEWWGRIHINDRRLLLALVGLDDSEEYARRPWKQLLQADRDKAVSELKHIQKLIEGLKWF